MKTGFKGIRNENGRPKGSLNLATLEVREKISLLLENNFDNIQHDIEQLSPRDRIRVIIELVKFVIPTLKAVELDASFEQKQDFQPLVINFVSSANKLIDNAATN
jgi:hypothetical protein